MIAAEAQGALADESERTTIERAVLAALEGLHQRAGGYLAELALYSGELSGGDLDDIKRRLLTQAPAVLVATGDADYDPRSTGGRRFVSTIDLHLYLCSNHGASMEARVHGDEASVRDGQADPGIHRMLVHCRARLMGETLAVAGLAPLQPSHDEALLVEPDLSVYRATYRATIAVQAPAAASRPIKSIEHRHRIADGGAANPVVIAVAEESSDA